MAQVSVRIQREESALAVRTMLSTSLQLPMERQRRINLNDRKEKNSSVFS